LSISAAGKTPSQNAENPRQFKTNWTIANASPGPLRHSASGREQQHRFADPRSDQSTAIAAAVSDVINFML